MPGVRPPAYRLPDATHLGAVELLVSDLTRSLDFYERILGLTAIARDDRSAALAPPGSLQPLIRLQSHPDVRSTGGRPRLGLYHFALLLPDRPSLGRFLSHVATTRVAMASADHAVSEALYLQDPDGLGIEVYRDRPRSEWRVQGDELYMTTERLDLRGLSEAGRGLEFNGLPVGTVLGHMHLHVGALEAADAFYHRALGFDRMVWSYPGALFLSAGGYHHHLGTNIWAGTAPPRAANEPGVLHWDIVLPTAADVDAAAQSLIASGAHVTQDGTSWVATDPWGTTLRLTA